MTTLKCIILAVLASGFLTAQEYDPSWQLKPPTDSWPGYHGDYSGRRHSPLTQITPANVENLGLAWSFQTGASGELKCSPLDGEWHFVYHHARRCLGGGCALRPSTMALQISAATRVFTSAIAAFPCTRNGYFFTTPDAHLVSLNAKDGTVRWNVVIADSQKGYWMTMSPMVIREPCDCRRLRRFR